MSVKTLSTEYAAGHTFRVRYDSSDGEYRVTVERNGKHMPARTYYTTDQRDALDTMQTMIDEVRRAAGQVHGAVKRNAVSLVALQQAVRDATPAWDEEDRVALYALAAVLRKQYLEAGLAATGQHPFHAYLDNAAAMVADVLRTAAGYLADQ